MIPTHLDQVWSLHLGRDQLADGRSLRVFNVIDDLDCKALDIEVDFSLSVERVMRSVKQVIGGRSKPSAIRCNNGPEYPSAAIVQWAAALGGKLEHIRLGKPQ